MENPDRKAIGILRKAGYIVSEKGLYQITDRPEMSAISLFPWKKIQQIQRVSTYACIYIHIWSGDAGIITRNIDLENKSDVPIVYKFLADKFIIYGMGTSPK